MELEINFQTSKNIQISEEDKARELDMITPKNLALRSYVTWLPMTVSVLDMIIV